MATRTPRQHLSSWGSSTLIFAVVGWAIAVGATAGPSLLPVSVLAQSSSSEDSPPTVDSEQVMQFAKVVLALEPHRQQAQVMANAAETDGDREQIRREFIRQATDIIEDNGMSVPDYNRITIELRGDDDLKADIETAIRELQQSELQQAEG